MPGPAPRSAGGGSDLVGTGLRRGHAAVGLRHRVAHGTGLARSSATRASRPSRRRCSNWISWRRSLRSPPRRSLPRAVAALAAKMAPATATRSELPRPRRPTGAARAVSAPLLAVGTRWAGGYYAKDVGRLSRAGQPSDVRPNVREKSQGTAVPKSRIRRRPSSPRRPPRAAPPAAVPGWPRSWWRCFLIGLAVDRDVLPDSGRSAARMAWRSATGTSSSASSSSVSAVRGHAVEVVTSAVVRPHGLSTLGTTPRLRPGTHP